MVIFLFIDATMFLTGHTNCFSDFNSVCIHKFRICQTHIIWKCSPLYKDLKYSLRGLIKATLANVLLKKIEIKFKYQFTLSDDSTSKPIYKLSIQCIVIVIKEFSYNTLVHILEHKKTQELKLSKMMTKLLLTQLILSENSSLHHLPRYLFTH